MARSAVPSNRPAEPAEPIAITGIGPMLPGAFAVPPFWNNLRTGSSQLGRIDLGEGLGVCVGAQLGPFEVQEVLPGLSARHAAKYSREILATMASIKSAWQDTGLDEAGIDPRRVSIILSSSRGLPWRSRHACNRADGTSGMLGSLTASPTNLTAIYLGAQGLMTTISAACVGGHHALGVALRELRAGSSDAVLVGGYDFPLVPDVMGVFQELGLLSRERDQPGRAVRPYNRDRDGTALGEGAITLCLERVSTVRARGARVYAHILDHQALNEAGHATRMDLSGRMTADLLIRAVTEVGRSVDEIGYVCGHGTATRANDLAECQALKALYPHRRAEELPPLGSNKPIYGHTLGAAGIINVAATALMLHHQSLAPTINISDVDPDCAQDHVADGPRPATLDLAVSLAFAIGSQTSVVILGASA
ncbi:beta-ketoacyl-[acyl-carrier-protein] synthase family protein [Protofrankia symbiont of Coriaria ruscifolia]|uniref:3-oxoacyl-[acyl-carrier protein] synthase n=1 Tax=Candidatus Protofrankia californiensis TaxID=1839754 RepID=A0A1C3P4P0_9ACTN|nr:beta-ketoacyl synthase N-terminal-like domain-containing protein [Protofrankia symbiont of Coriaria ruscifolia]SBW24730.1 3-oxoacyl-[acyl-carrier protein] synthase [Candidatus Protofrankia californiensis]